MRRAKRRQTGKPWFAVEEDASAAPLKKPYLQMRKRQAITAADALAFGDSGDGHCVHALYFAPRFFSGAARRARPARRPLATLQGWHRAVPNLTTEPFY